MVLPSSLKTLKFLTSPLPTVEKSVVRDIFLTLAQQQPDAQKAQFSWSEKSIEEALNRYSFCVWQEELVLGRLRAFICYQSFDEFCEILVLGVPLEDRGQGHMCSLLKKFCGAQKDLGKAVFLEVHESNSKALQLYEKCGFQLQRRRSMYYQDGATALVLEYHE